MDTIQLNATSLRDYVACPRRFQLRHLLTLPWPAVETEPLPQHELSRARGAKFHRLVERYHLGIDGGMLARMVTDPVLRQWWQVYQDQSPVSRDHIKRVIPEKLLQARILDCTLTAYLDLVVIDPDNTITIYDWKTTNQKPNRKYWEQNIQSLVYLYGVGEQRNRLTDSPTPLSKIRMVYWFVQYPAEAITINYSEQRHEESTQKLSALVQQVSEQVERETGDEWEKTDDLRRCEFCSYRSLCGRGVLPASDSVYEDMSGGE